MTNTETIIDLLSVTESGVVEVRESVVTMEDGVQVSQHFKRHCVCPGEDYSQEDTIVQAACQTAHTPAVIAAYLALTTIPIVVLTLGDLVSKTLIEIDSDTDAIYGAVLGNRGPEYLDAEIAAKAYKDAGYTGTVPEDVQSYATAMGWIAQQAADDILLTAANWRPAKSAIRANRLAAKEAVRDSLTISEVEAVLAWWAIFVVTIRGQLGI